MNAKARVLVVGTTPDYIEWIRRSSPGRALFVTDPANRDLAMEPTPHPAEEVRCFLDDAEEVKKNLQSHLRRWDLTVDGIACFDCESMELAATLAEYLSLPYPSAASIRNSRDKYMTKVLWHQNSVQCPRVKLIQSADEAYTFLQQLDDPVVIKPLTGSGSELVFLCDSKKECDRGVELLRRGLQDRKANRLYNGTANWFLAEEMVGGNEYSCDFLIENNQARIIRLTRKIKNPKRPFGTITGYLLADCATEGLNRDDLEQILFRGATALGITNALCMVDFLRWREEISLLEITPRPGGDCIPFLLKRGCGLDILSLALDFAQQRPLSYPEHPDQQYIALRLHAESAGTLRKIDTDRLQQDSRIRETHITRRPGHRILMPPEDYDSWYLGHIIFQPTAGQNLEKQCRDLSRLLVLEIDHDHRYQ